MIPRTYPESFRVIAQKMSEKIDFKSRFSGRAIKNPLRSTIRAVTESAQCHDNFTTICDNMRQDLTGNDNIRQDLTGNDNF